MSLDPAVCPFSPTIHNHLGREPSFEDRWSAFMQKPTLMWFMEPSDANLTAMSLLGLTLASAVFIGGAANSWIMAALWSAPPFNPCCSD